MRKSFVIISGVLTLVHLIGAAVRLFHAWLSLCRTIVYLSIVYTLGQVVLAISAIHDITDTNKDGTPDNMTFHVWAQRTPTRDTRPSGWLFLTLCSFQPLRALSMVGLLLIALGTGGIKPCVAAFGGDQFEDHQVIKKKKKSFSNTNTKKWR